MRILVTGSGSGLGAAIVDELELNGHEVVEYDHAQGCDVLNPSVPDGRLDCLINCAGVNEIDWLEYFTETQWDRVMGVNAKGIYMMTRACLPKLKASRGVVINIISNASHIPMTCSLAYNASKAAAEMMTRQLARELTKRDGITVFGISPNKLRGTGMSIDIEERVCKTRGWTREQAAAYQKQALVTGEETDPSSVAEFLVWLLSEKHRHIALSGCVLEYGA